MTVLHASVRGRFKIEAVRVDDRGAETRRVLADWFDNLITDAGLNRMGTDDYPYDCMYCQIGAGTTTPQVTDGALQSFLASTSTLQGNVTTSRPTAAPYYAAKVITYRFSAAASNMNISEIGVGWAAQGSLFSRALILNEFGIPSTITVLTGEYLDVTYECRLYAPDEDVTGIVTISGVDYDFIARACKVTSGSYPGWSGASSTVDVEWAVRWFSSSSHTVYDGTIGTVTQTPSGTALSPFGSASTDPYSNNSYYRDFGLAFSLTQANLAAGIRSVVIGFKHSAYQIQFTPAIPKTASKSMTLRFRVSWGRYVP